MTDTEERLLDAALVSLKVCEANAVVHASAGYACAGCCHAIHRLRQAVAAAAEEILSEAADAADVWLLLEIDANYPAKLYRAEKRAYENRILRYLELP